ncbi:hypothetical protein HELRODRAFT_184510 [Helobdella robusta]|uniref:Nudix hydrolase domain-containing protein n=1 Tax=Helobdella robusta TaxID=6412 RepID=T1FLC9_HELRO|nr:hypothetical protein HELRODRAFT_184510 [Helobdella robusta]ESN93268.1 hypothetical protein HELRODRAFT_184510 [Helobdella robusta]
MQLRIEKIQFLFQNEEISEHFNKLMFKCEHAYWHYIDLILENPKEPGISHSEFVFQLLKCSKKTENYVDNFHKNFQKWVEYKTQIPTCGAILLDPSLQFCVMVQGSSGKWGFPKGKMGEGEEPADCAIREVSYAFLFQFKNQTMTDRICH